ncbi:pyridoxal phosphate-dependent aminotransferase, partial [candidate division KSB1 bacterium]|nr:pyridoxal phosphate-dependent aminotransferase [candidate division KSB1 bacterium]
SCGAKHTLVNACMAILSHGDEAIIPAPYWVSYPDMVRVAEGKPVIIETGIDSDFKVTPQQLEAAITDKTRVLFLNSPSNPSGSCYSREELVALGEVLKSHPQIVVLADDIYEHIHWAATPFCSMATACPDLIDQVVTINGVSKCYAMTGWRLGFGVMREDLAKKVEQLMINSNSCTATFSQYAAVEALKGPTDEVDAMVETFRKRRDFIVAGLNEIPDVSCITPKGAFYVFPNVKKIKMSTQELEHYLLNEAGVAILSGTAFGKYGNGYLRFSYANSIKNIGKALERMKDALERI